MASVKKILFPVDLSDVGPKIVPTAIAMARQFDAELHLLFVTTSLEQLTSYYAPDASWVALEEGLETAGEEKLKEFQEKYCTECPITKRVVLKGDPAEEILRYIRSADIDMVVIGTHGRKGLDRILFGSVAERVVREAPVPVLTVNPYRNK